jgi:ATP-binding cassette subfamily C protein CydC
MLRRLATLISLGIPKNREYLLGVGIASLQAIASLALMAFSAWLISRASEEPPVMYLSVGIVAVRGLALSKASFRYFERLLEHNAVFRHMAQLRSRVFEAVIPLFPAGLSGNRADTITRLTSDVEETQNLSLRIIPPLVQSIVVSTVTVVFFWFAAPTAALWLLFWILVAAFLALPISYHFSRGSNRELAQRRSKLNQETMDLLENLDVLETFGWVEHRRKNILTIQETLLKGADRQALSAGIGQSLFLLCTTAATVGAAYLVAGQVDNKTMPGVMLAVFSLVPLALFDTLNSLQPLPGMWTRYSKSSNRVLSVLESPVPKEIAEPRASLLQPLNNPVAFQQLELTRCSAKYPGQEAPAFNNFSLKLEAGQNALLTGPSGAGKSSIANVLVGFLALDAGEYRINDVPRSDIDTAALRRLIGYQEQNPTIFQGSVRANLLIAKPSASDQELWDVLRRVKLAATFEQREGLETQLASEATKSQEGKPSG